MYKVQQRDELDRIIIKKYDSIYFAFNNSTRCVKLWTDPVWPRCAHIIREINTAYFTQGEGGNTQVHISKPHWIEFGSCVDFDNAQGFFISEVRINWQLIKNKPSGFFFSSSLFFEANHDCFIISSHSIDYVEKERLSCVGYQKLRYVPLVRYLISVWFTQINNITTTFTVSASQENTISL